MSHEPKSRERGENWIKVEKEIFMDIMRSSAAIIEQKQTDTNTNERKIAEWVKVQGKLRELTGKSREISQLKGFWRRAKRTAKKNVLEYKRAVRSGGGLPPISPSLDDIKVMQLCPKDFIMEYNKYDSDGSSQMEGHVYEADAHQDMMFGVDLNETNRYDMEVSVDEIVTVPDIHLTEIKIEPTEEKSEEIEEKKIEREINGQSPKIHTERVKKNVCSNKTITVMELKKKKLQMLDEEHQIKMNYHREELAHQELRHKLEIELLLLDKHKKELEVTLLKKQLD